MTERPIIFSSPMVRAILAGRKTQTRRALNPQPHADFIAASIFPDSLMLRPAYLSGSETHKMLLRLPRPGDTLWVRETWRTLHRDDVLSPRNLAEDSSKITYEADPERRNPLWAFGRIRSPIHMPRWASRITLRVADVRVQRLQDISEEDAMEEGCLPARWNCETPRDHFSDLWNSLNAKRGLGWDTNPWVAAISFERSNADG